MDWKNELAKRYESGANHVFLPYLNVRDEYLDLDAHFKYLAESIRDVEPIRSAVIVAYFNRGQGVYFPSVEMQEYFLKILGIPHEDFELQKRNVSTAFQWLGQLLVTSRTEALAILRKAREGSGPRTIGVSDTAPFGVDGPLAAVVVEFLETIVPPDAATSGAEDRAAFVTLQVWAQNRVIRQKGNIAVYIASDLGSIAADLYESTRGIHPLKLELPDEAERLAVITAMRKTIPSVESDIPDDHIAYLTGGLPRTSVRQLLQTARAHGVALTSEYVFERTKRIIEEESEGMLTVMQPKWPFEVIGGLEGIKSYLDGVARNMVNREFLKVPMGLLFMGPPGTAKTICADVLASRAGVPMVVMRNIRDPFVGMSERRLERVLHIIVRRAPVICFIDEIDQQIQARGTVYHGDSGVGARMAGRQFEFMSDSLLQGRVLWVGATNRPELIDPALLRPGRFSTKIPFLPPDSVERAKIFSALLLKMKIVNERTGGTLVYSLTEEQYETLGRLACRILRVEVNERRLVRPGRDEDLSRYDPGDLVDFTGAEIEAILQGAYEKSADDHLTFDAIERAVMDFLPTRNFFEFKAMTDEALIRTSDPSFIPERWQAYAEALRMQRIVR